MDSGLLLAKIVGSAFAGIYGLYATLNDFHETRYGKKFLSKRGKWGIALLCFVTVLNVSSDSIKQKIDLDSSHAESMRRDAETARIQEINAQLGREVTDSAAISSNLKDALALLRNSNETIAKNIADTEKILNPIQDSMLAEAYFSIPIDQSLVEPYAKRAKGSPFALRFGQESFPVPRDKELELYKFLVGERSVILIFSKAEAVEAAVFGVRCIPPTAEQMDLQMSWDDRNNLKFTCNAIVHRQTDDGSFRGYADILKSKVLILMRFPGSGNIKCLPEKIVLHTSNPKYSHLYSGRMILLDHMTRTAHGTETAWTAKISSQPNFDKKTRLGNLQ